MYRRNLLSVGAALAILISSNGTLTNLDPNKFIVFGMGIDPDSAQVVLPVRHLFVQLVDNDGQNVTDDVSNDCVRISVECREDRSTWAQAINRHDGSFLLRYRLSRSCKDPRVLLTTGDGRPIAQSPYKVGRYIRHEKCDCPIASVKDFLQVYQCSNASKTLKDSLKTWPRRSVNFTWVVDEVKRRFASHPGAYSLCHYVIKGNRLYRRCYGQHVGFNMFSDAILLSVMRKVRLPDMEFFMNLGDWPLEKSRDNPIPILSWCGSLDTKDVILPTYDVTESTLEAMGRVSLDMQSVQGMSRLKWSDKVPKAFWRGRDSRQERLDLVDLSRKHPAMIDAAITNFFFFRDQMDRYGPKVNHVPFGDFFNYTYQINLDGTVAAYRFPYLLAGNSLVLKQDSDYYEWFYPELTPWVHYVPVKRDLSDLLEKIQWAMANEAAVLRIVRRAQQFARDQLQPMDIFCSYVRGLVGYSRILAAGPEQPGEEFESVAQPTDEKDSCDCQQSTSASRSSGDRSEL